MNDYVIFVNGQLAPATDHGFTIAQLNSEKNGRYLRLTSTREGIKRLDVFEIRASNIVRRYQCLEPKGGVFECLSVANSF